MAIEYEPKTIPTQAEYEASADRLAKLSKLVGRTTVGPGEPSLKEGAEIYTRFYITHSDMRTVRERYLGNG